MRQKSLIVMIVMIIGVFVFFSGQLTAEEAVGVSIFPKIETPPPYPQSDGNQALVWSTTIDQPGATWIKIHFSDFQLNDKDFVNLIDEQDRIIGKIQFKNVNDKHGSGFKLQKKADQTVNFWTLAVDGQKIRIELRRESNKLTGSGFTIDEIGIGSKSLNDRGLGPINNDNANLDTDADFLHSLDKKGLDLVLSQTIVPEQMVGRMLYKKGTTWYTGKGILVNSSTNQFLPQEHCIDSQEIVNTMEVRFYSHYYLENKDYHVYHVFYGDKLIDNYSSNNDGLITLKKNMKMEDFYLKDEKPVNKSELNSTLSGTCTYCCEVLVEIYCFFPPPPYASYCITIITCIDPCECTCPCCCCSS
ncbi:MAG: hypothetical protein NT166_12640 [Candidatus Aminicenantes bacterium]|nr:hypothetical protein [Candidatus Aminicenantes bacterium]